jgi:hypothetical protein
MHAPHSFPRANPHRISATLLSAVGGSNTNAIFGEETQMDVTSRQIVEGNPAGVVEPESEEFDVIEPIRDEADESERPELSIGELEEIFSEL